jgi:hypothetical protein
METPKAMVQVHIRWPVAVASAITLLADNPWAVAKSGAATQARNAPKQADSEVMRPMGN